jgi:hypothetical protein
VALPAALSEYSLCSLPFYLRASVFICGDFSECRAWRRGRLLATDFRRFTQIIQMGEKYSEVAALPAAMS